MIILMMSDLNRGKVDYFCQLKVIKKFNQGHSSLLKLSSTDSSIEIRMSYIITTCIGNGKVFISSKKICHIL